MPTLKNWVVFGDWIIWNLCSCCPVNNFQKYGVGHGKSKKALSFFVEQAWCVREYFWCLFLGTVSLSSRSGDGLLGRRKKGNIQPWNKPVVNSEQSNPFQRSTMLAAITEARIPHMGTTKTTQTWKGDQTREIVIGSSHLFNDLVFTMGLGMGGSWTLSFPSQGELWRDWSHKPAKPEAMKATSCSPRLPPNRTAKSLNKLPGEQIKG